MSLCFVPVLLFCLYRVQTLVETATLVFKDCYKI